MTVCLALWRERERAAFGIRDLAGDCHSDCESFGSRANPHPPPEVRTAASFGRPSPLRPRWPHASPRPALPGPCPPPHRQPLPQEQDGQVASVLQEADPFIPPLTQSVKGPSPRTAAASASA